MKLPSLLFSLLAPFALAELPEGLGLSDKYVHDEGIKRDPAVLLFENFETGEIADLSKSWNDDIVVATGYIGPTRE
jgi:hypothetical protein